MKCDEDAWKADFLARWCGGDGVEKFLPLSSSKTSPANCNRVSATLETPVGDGRGVADEFGLVPESSGEGGTARAVIKIRDVG